MKYIYIILFLLITIFTVHAADKELPSIITASMLKEALNSKSIIVLDVRKVEEFKDAHIPGSICL
ncbi:MAG TPA: rhodanese-like domain-containing protein, partial [Syntrophorhabdaceae bacterium]|nr:rhodanese-like domain-containing protein [Syntrophorhabdaceae bacterium]